MASNIISVFDSGSVGLLCLMQYDSGGLCSNPSRSLTRVKQREIDYQLIIVILHQLA